MKLVRIAIVLLFISFCSVNAYAEKLYATGWVGPNFRPDAKTLISGSGISGTAGADIDSDVGFNIGGSLGTHLKKFRVEGEIAYRENSADPAPGFGLGSDISLLSFMGNAIYDLKPTHGVRPYLGAGVGFGIASIDNDANGADDSDLVLAYQLMAGITKDLTPKFSLFVGYKLLGTSDPEFRVGGLSVDSEYTSHELLFGGRLNF